ncbi:hypothetical protein ABK040_011750 [Willaertia magna]
MNQNDTHPHGDMGLFPCLSDHTCIFLSTHISFYWASTFFYTAFLVLCVNYTENFFHAKGFSTDFSKRKTLHLKIGIFIVSLSSHFIELSFFICCIIFMILDKLFFTKIIIICQLSFHMSLSFLIIFFFIIWIFISRKVVWSDVLYPNTEYNNVTERMFIGACSFAFLLLLKGFADAILGIYVTNCNLICPNVQILLNSCLSIAGDLLPLTLVYYVFWTGRKVRGSANNNNNRIVNNNTLLQRAGSKENLLQQQQYLNNSKEEQNNHQMIGANNNNLIENSNANNSNNNNQSFGSKNILMKSYSNNFLHNNYNEQQHYRDRTASDFSIEDANILTLQPSKPVIDFIVPPSPIVEQQHLHYNVGNVFEEVSEDDTLTEISN